MKHQIYSSLGTVMISIKTISSSCTFVEIYFLVMWTTSTRSYQVKMCVPLREVSFDGGRRKNIEQSYFMSNNVHIRGKPKFEKLQLFSSIFVKRAPSLLHQSHLWMDVIWGMQQSQNDFSVATRDIKKFSPDKQVRLVMTAHLVITDLAESVA